MPTHSDPPKKITINFAKYGAVTIPIDVYNDIEEIRKKEELLRDQTEDQIRALLVKYDVASSITGVLSSALFDRVFHESPDDDDDEAPTLFAYDGHAAIHKNLYVKRGSFTLDHHQKRAEFRKDLLVGQVNGALRELQWLNVGIFQLKNLPPDTKRSEVLSENTVIDYRGMTKSDIMKKLFQGKF